jgi:hypothetical protein
VVAIIAEELKLRLVLLTSTLLMMLVLVLTKLVAPTDVDVVDDAINGDDDETVKLLLDIVDVDGVMVGINSTPVCVPLLVVGVDVDDIVPVIVFELSFILGMVFRLFGGFRNANTRVILLALSNWV